MIRKYARGTRKYERGREGEDNHQARQEKVKEGRGNIKRRSQKEEAINEYRSTGPRWRTFLCAL
jgi:hypothetical protein